ncbi:hypothetical protein Ae201684P_009582 [Aphanomyces euteiches]|nr:hypothetical protein Ae201684P_020647 [Aphanomyces euteiches]KAH9088061.1 hypothetical protein Ae201684P_009582 [Aphanomyces euteiches]
MKSALVLSCLAGLAAAQNNFGCGNLVPCTTPDGSFVECQNPARRGCCKGLPYWYFNTTAGFTAPQACCEDADGQPFIGLGGSPTVVPTTAAPTPSPTTFCGNLLPCKRPDGFITDFTIGPVLTSQSCCQDAD